MLPAIRELGYKDAFIKSVNNARLVPITSFETGIKKPLIPITLGNEPPVAPAPSPSPGPQVVTYGGSPTPAVNQQPTPVGYGNANPTPAVSPSVLPNIRGRFKRTSAQKLQVVLKEKGYYTGEIDGYYGNGTATAYRAATEQMPEIQKMRLLSSLRTVPAGDYISQWPEVTILMTTATEMSGGRADQDLALRSIGIRQELYNATQALSPAAASRARAWELTLWENLDSWATTDPLHAQLTSVLRVAYYQSQVRLEDYFMDRGLPSDAAKDLALATLQGLIGAELERFL
ncbi:MAG: peptidoglycan-binding domain-containing protein [Bacteroidota bacterium]